MKLTLRVLPVFASALSFLVINGLTFCLPEVRAQIDNKQWSDLPSEYRKVTMNYAMSTTTFNRIVKKDLEYTIVGQNSPASGVSIDLSSQAKIKINGRIPTKKGVHTVELDASQKNSEIGFFENGSYTGQLEAKYNWNYIPLWNYYNILPGSDRVIEKIFREKASEISERALDTAIVIVALFRVSHVFEGSVYSALTDPYKMKIIEADSMIKENYPFLPARRAFPILGQELWKMERLRELMPLVKTLSKKYFPDDDVQSFETWDSLSVKIYKSKEIKKEELLLSDFKKSILRLASRYENIVAAEIKAASSFWLRKNLFWFTFSPSVNYQVYQMFEKDLADTTIGKKASPFLTYKFSAWFSTYRVYKDVSHLLRFGVEGVLGNNYKSFNEVKFIERLVIDTDKDGNSIVKQAETLGLSRKPEVEKQYDFFVNAYLEYYRLPNENFKPGFSTRISYMRDGILIKNYRKVVIQASLVLNVLNKEKEKAIVTVLPYIRYNYFTNKSQMDAENLESFRRFGENLSIGVTIGLPIKGLLSLEK